MRLNFDSQLCTDDNLMLLFSGKKKRGCINKRRISVFFWLNSLVDVDKTLSLCPSFCVFYQLSIRIKEEMLGFGTV